MAQVIEVLVSAVLDDGKWQVRVVQGEVVLQFIPFSARKAADVMVLGSPSAKSKALAKRMHAAADAAQAKADEAKAAKLAAQPQVRVFPEGWDFATVLPYQEFKAMPARQQRWYSQEHRAALAAQATAVAEPVVSAEPIAF